MADYVTLMGAEDVLRAGHAMRAAAEEMTRASNNLDSTLFRFQTFMDDWLIRYEAVLEKQK